MALTSKTIKVPSNGQISIGKQWAGAEISVQQVSETELRIVKGAFLPADQLNFYTSDSMEQLASFDQWANKKSARKTNLTELKARLGSKKAK
jgi:hypothetical protein